MTAYQLSGMHYATGNEAPNAVFKQTFLVYTNGSITKYLLEMAHGYTGKKDPSNSFYTNFV